MKKKGFTLIELLAVIVILAIIALIAVPIVLQIIEDSKKESLARSIDLYIDTVQKRITGENMKVKYDPDKCVIQENGNVKCYKGETILKTSTKEDELKIEMNGEKPTDGIITFENNKVSYENLLLEGTYYHMDIEGNKETSKEKKTKEPEVATISETEDYKGYYADVDGDGIVDGVIYADLAHASRENAKWGPGYNGAYASDGEYSYTAKTGLKEYTISENKHTGENAKFGEKEIITLKPGSSGNSRFYVMALNDFTTEAYTDPNDSNNSYPAYTNYYWYKNAFGKMPDPVKDTSTDFGTGYDNTGTMIRIWNNNGAETGWTTGATKDKQDIWKHIQEEYQEGWYIPSHGEWAAFADYFEITSDYDTGLYVANGGNYNSTYGLSSYYWSSSQGSTSLAWGVGFNLGRMGDSTVTTNFYVRLGATF